MAYEDVHNPYIQSVNSGVLLQKLYMPETIHSVPLSDSRAIKLADTYLPGPLINGDLDTTDLRYPSRQQESFLSQHLFYQSSAQQPVLGLGSDHISVSVSSNGWSYQSSTTPESESTEELGHGLGDSLAWSEFPPSEWRHDYPFGAHFSNGKRYFDTELGEFWYEEQVRLNKEGNTNLILPAGIAGRVHSEQDHLCNMQIQTVSNDDVAEDRFEFSRPKSDLQTLSPAALGEATDHLAAEGPPTLSYNQTWDSPTKNVLRSHREAQDQYLIISKLSGMSYKEIREKGQFKEAESTLRGRFRTLTKSKDHRVRKPQWRERDVELLRQAVFEFTRGSGSEPMVVDGKNAANRWEVAKIPWMKIAEFVALHGSYHFGNATCRKKWDEIKETL